MAVFTLTNGNDTLNRLGQGTADTVSALEGADVIVTGVQNDFVLGNQGNDSLVDFGGNNTLDGGQGNDHIRVADGSGNYFGREGADTIDATGSFGVTIVGGLDSTDQADSLLGSSFGDFILGNGGADTIVGAGGPETLVGGFGDDTIVGSADADFIWGNEGADTISAGTGANTVFAGLGNDVASGTGVLWGNEGNDTITATGANAVLNGGTIADGSADGSDRLNANGQAGIVLNGQAGSDTLVAAGNTTMSGGDGGDLFDVNAAGTTGAVRITDLNWSVDQLDVPVSPNLDRAGNAGLIDAANLQAAAQAAILIVDGGNVALRVAAQFGFLGHTYVALDQFGGAAADTIVDITGVTGTITVGNFIT